MKILQKVLGGLLFLTHTVYSLGYIPMTESIGISSTNLRNRSKSYRIRRNNAIHGHSAVQDHSRSPILVLIESPYATSN